MKKTLAATMIVKNEAHNLPRLFKNLNGLVDCIYITDTGSTDDTVKYIQSEAALLDAGCPVKLFHFKWIDDFAEARNYNLSMIKEDYWMWIDGDDQIANKEAFTSWKSTTINLADAWYLPYHYAFNEKGECVCKFVRERVFKTSLNVKFHDFIHEGVKLPEGIKAQAINSWHVEHLRTATEAEIDKGRNLRILESKQDSLNTRLKFYLGKEYFDAGKHDKSCESLKEVVKKADLNHGDRILAFQYLIHGLVLSRQFEDALKYGHLAIHLDPLRAEYHCFMGDTWLNLQDPHKAIPYFQAAKGCLDRGHGLSHEFSYQECYSTYPRLALAKIYYNLGRFEEAIEEVKNVEHKEAKEIMYEAHKAVSATAINQNAIECDDIVITCHAQGAYPWNEKLYREKGLGGSETAAVEMGYWLKKLTGRQVKIFNNSTELFVSDSGVEYRPAIEAYEYFKKWKPKLHIAWRHSARLTNAPSFIWCHDLVTPGADQLGSYDKIMALSDFHVDFLNANLGIPKAKIMRTRNGIDADMIESVRNNDLPRQRAKVLWPNSLDRGLDHAIKIMDLVKKEIPEAELHVFYGIENMFKYGLAEKAEMLKKMMDERPWIKYVGNVDKPRLMREYATADVWLYPADFIETFCITALEAPLLGCWPVVREFGALNSTMKEFKEKGLCDMHDIDCTDYEKWAEIVISAIKNEKWKTLEANRIPTEGFSWKSVAQDWIKNFSL